jgi:hypothetical protein
MTDEELRLRVLELRGQGRTPKQIAQALGVRPAVVGSLVRSIAGGEAANHVEPAVTGCWVNPAWARGLAVDGPADWPDGAGGDDDESLAGLVAVLVAREHRYEKVALCGYLLDVYCMGVRDVFGPRAVPVREAPAFVERYFEGYPSAAVEAPIELGRHLVWGAVAYARGLGFEPDSRFAAAEAHLGALEGTPAITFGRSGRPAYRQRPGDDVAQVLRTLEAAAGEGGYDVIESDAHEERVASAHGARPGTRGGNAHSHGDAPVGGRMWRSRNR